jgi:Raf kinase inhibitor-like YbhB/YbcL family protein
VPVGGVSARRLLVAAASVTVAALIGAGCGSSTSASSNASTSVSTTASTSATTSAATATATVPQLSSTVSLSSPTRRTTSTSTTSTASSTTSPSGGAGLAAGFRLSSPAFASGGAIPTKYTCDGQDVSLPLTWSGVPAATKELVLVMRDPDAPTPDFVHWALAGISPSASGFPAGGVSGQVVPGRNSLGSLGYRGPCPPTGASAHHYVITLSALASASGLHSGFSADQIQTQAIGIATLTGTYRR